MNPEQAKALREPFDPADLDKKPQPYKKESPKGRCGECHGWHGLPAMHLDYAGHALVTARLLQVDPEWTWEPVSDPQSLGLPTAVGGMWIRLTIAGVTRLGYGDADGKTGGNAVKETIGDAIRNAGMRFGIGLDLWRKEDKRRAAPDDAEEADPPSTPVPPEETDEDWLNNMTLIVEEASDEAALRAAWDTVDAEHRAGRVSDSDRTGLSKAVTQRLQQLRRNAAGAA